LDEIDEIMVEGALSPLDRHYPNLQVHEDSDTKTQPSVGHNVLVLQPWAAHANFDLTTDPELQLEECVSLANTLKNWKVIDKRIVFAHSLKRKQLLPPKAFAELKDTIHSTQGVSAVMFGVDVLSAIQLRTLEKELQLAVFDRFTTVLNIFRQHARTKEAKIQLALAEIPYIKSHLREVHESSEFSSTAESLKMIVGGAGETYYHRRVDILKRRENRLRYLLEEVRQQREKTRRSRRKNAEMPIVSVVGYTNSGKSSLIKYLTCDDKITPKDQLFATLDVTVHTGQLPSNRSVLYLDTVGFLSRIPTLLIEAFSATLKDVQESDLILHILDISHPDHKLQYATVIKALESLKVSKNLLDTRLTIGNKVDKLDHPDPRIDLSDLPRCDLQVSVTSCRKMDELVKLIDTQLLSNLRHEILILRVENGGKKYNWLRKNTTINECQPDPEDGNYLICSCIFSPAFLGRWKKQFGIQDFYIPPASLNGRSNFESG